MSAMQADHTKETQLDKYRVRVRDLLYETLRGSSALSYLCARGIESINRDDPYFRSNEFISQVSSWFYNLNKDCQELESKQIRVGRDFRFLIKDNASLQVIDTIERSPEGFDLTKPQTMDGPIDKRVHMSYKESTHHLSSKEPYVVSSQREEQLQAIQRILTEAQKGTTTTIAPVFTSSIPSRISLPAPSINQTTSYVDRPSLELLNSSRSMTPTRLSYTPSPTLTPHSGLKRVEDVIMREGRYSIRGEPGLETEYNSPEEGRIELLDESQARVSRILSSQPSTYLRVTKAYKGEVYIIKGRRVYPDGSKTKSVRQSIRGSPGSVQMSGEQKAPSQPERQGRYTNPTLIGTYPAKQNGEKSPFQEEYPNNNRNTTSYGLESAKSPERGSREAGEATSNGVNKQLFQEYNKSSGLANISSRYGVDRHELSPSKENIPVYRGSMYSEANRSSEQSPISKMEQSGLLESRYIEVEDQEKAKPVNPGTSVTRQSSGTPGEVSRQDLKTLHRHPEPAIRKEAIQPVEVKKERPKYVAKFKEKRQVQVLQAEQQATAPKQVKTIEDAIDELTDYEEATVDLEPLDDDTIHRFDLNSSGTVLYGGRDINAARVDEAGRITKVKKTAVQVSICFLKLLENGCMVVNESISHDLVMFDQSLVEVNRLSGLPMFENWIQYEPQITKNRRCQIPGVDSHVLWFNGLYRTALVDLSTFKPKELVGIWKTQGKDSFAYVATASKSLKKIIGIGFQDPDQTLNFYEDTPQGGKATSKKMKEVLGMEQAQSLLISNGEKFVFVGGGLDDPNGTAKLAAIEFSSELRVVVEQDITTSEMSVIWCMERFYNSDIIFTGGYGSVTILFFDGKAFQQISTVGDVDNYDPILDMKLIDYKLYVLSQPARELQKITFIDKAQAHPFAPPKSPDSLASKRFAQAVRNITKVSYEVPGRADFLKISSDGQKFFLRLEGQLAVVDRPLSGKLDMSTLKRTNTAFVEVFGSKDKIATISPMDNSLFVENRDYSIFDTLDHRGLKEIEPGHSPVISYSTCNDEHILGWPCGNNDLIVIDFNKYEYDVIEEFFAGDSAGHLPISVKSCLDGRKVAALSISKQTKDYGLYFWCKTRQEGGASSFRPVKSIVSHLNTVKFIEPTENGKFITMTNESKDGKVGHFVVCRFEQKFGHLQSIKLEKKPVYMCKLATQDVFVVGLEDRSLEMFLVESDSSVYALGVVKDASKGDILSVQAYNNTIYLLGSNCEIVAVQLSI